MMKFVINQKVLFFTRSILKITEGKVIGVFASPMDKDGNDYKYIYQIEYLKHFKEKDKKDELMIAVPESDDHISDSLEDRKAFEKVFQPFYKKAIEEDLKQATSDLENVKIALKADEDFKKIVEDKIIELKAEAL